MYENETREVIEQRMLDRLDPGIDPRIGSVNQTHAASLAIELEKLYQELEYCDNQRTPDTANRLHMERWGKAFSVNPLEATYAILKATIEMEGGAECPIGSRFSQGDLNFIVIEHEDGSNYSVQCEEPGEIGNTAYGRIIPIVNIKGLLSATITGTEIPGTDVEGDDSYRERLQRIFSEKAYGWNMAMYIEEISKMQGVGGVKVIRHFEDKDYWVGVYIIDSTYHKASEELVESVQEKLLPLLPDHDQPTIENSGDGLVAIGHIPIVKSAEEVVIDITLHLELQEKTYGQVEEPIREKIENYLTESCNKRWDDSNGIIIRTSGIETAVLEVEGVINVYDTEINGIKANVELESLQITKLGTITNESSNRLKQAAPTVKLSEVGHGR